jgi:2OG-Fe(II) oxygenase superfamily
MFTLGAGVIVAERFVYICPTSVHTACDLTNPLQIHTYVILVTTAQGNAILYIKSQGCFLREHVDNRGDYDNIICTLSLGCDALMNYRRETSSSSGARRAEGTPTGVLLPRRSLQIMTGDWRYKYYHSIPNENLLGERRVSITFRRTRIRHR